MNLIYSDHALLRARERRAPVFTALPDGAEPAAILGDGTDDARHVYLRRHAGRVWKLVVSCRLVPDRLGGRAARVVTIAERGAEEEGARAPRAPRTTHRGKLHPLTATVEALRESEALSLIDGW